MLHVIAALMLTTTVVHQDTALITVPVFQPVIEHAAPRYPSRKGVKVVLSDRVAKGNCIPPCAETGRMVRVIPAEVARQLQASGAIAGTCAGQMGCPGFPGHTFIRLSIPYRLPTGYRVLPGDGSLSLLVGTGPSFIGEVVHVALEVFVYGPCLKDREPCEYPDIVLSQYFLQQQAD